MRSLSRTTSLATLFTQRTMTNVYTPEEIVRHNRENDLWIVVNGNVYDVTKFLKTHPGGDDLLMEKGGQDATKCFEEIGHSLEAEILRETFKIGKVADRASAHELNMSTVSVMDYDDWIYQEPQQTEETLRLRVIFVSIFIIYVVIYYIICC